MTISGFVRVAANAAQSLARVAINPQQADAATKTRRLAVCAGCDLKKTKAATPKRPQYDYCDACGCPLDSKTGSAASTCPKSKW